MHARAARRRARAGGPGLAAALPRRSPATRRARCPALPRCAAGKPGRSPLLGINPADIARIEVLKDIGSTAMYGVRGANGVVLITTWKQ